MTFKKTCDIIKTTKGKILKKKGEFHMRLVHYIVERTDKTQFETTSYAVATANGNRIVKTYLTRVDETTEKQKKDAAIHRAKVREAIQKKRDA